MTQEEKQLLLIDLCARLPYKTYIEIVDEDGNVYDEVKLEPQHINTVRYDESISIRPYLRPMSSMTEEEKKYISERCGFSISEPIGNECVLIMPIFAAGWLIDFYNEHHLDFRGLIPMGLALEAKEGMYGKI